MKLSNDILSENSHLVFILPAPYIVEDICVSIIREHCASKVTFYINSESFSKTLRSELDCIQAENCNVTVYEVTSFALKGIIQHKDFIRAIKNNQDTNVVLFLQSFEPILCRVLANAFASYSKYTVLIGLQFSIPVFLFRDPIFVSKLISHKKMSDIMYQRGLKLRDKREKINRKYFKIGFIRIIEKIIDLIFLNDKYRCTRIVRASSYVKPGTVNLHVTNNAFYKFCLEQIFDEPIILLDHERKPRLSETKQMLLRGDYRELTILGPVTAEMLECYIVDIKNLYNSGFAFERINIKPHPRFLQLALELRDAVLISAQCFNLQDVAFLEKINVDSDSSIVLGYYSSLFDELKDQDYQGLGLISELATCSRYPYLPISMLSGQIVGFYNSSAILGGDGKISYSEIVDQVRVLDE